MLRSVITWMDSISINMMIGSLLREVAAEYEKEGVPREQARHAASEEIKTSLAHNRIDLHSYAQVKAWRKSYAADARKALQNDKS
jgi:hypothetical protein